MRTSYRDIALLACCQALLLVNNSGLITMNGLVGFALVDNKTFATLGVTSYVLGSARHDTLRERRAGIQQRKYRHPSKPSVGFGCEPQKRRGPTLLRFRERVGSDRARLRSWAAAESRRRLQKA